MFTLPKQGEEESVLGYKSDTKLQPSIKSSWNNILWCRGWSLPMAAGIKSFGTDELLELSTIWVHLQSETWNNCLNRFHMALTSAMHNLSRCWNMLLWTAPWFFIRKKKSLTKPPYLYICTNFFELCIYAIWVIYLHFCHVWSEPWQLVGCDCEHCLCVCVRVHISPPLLQVQRHVVSFSHSPVEIEVSHVFGRFLRCTHFLIIEDNPSVKRTDHNHKAQW